MASKGEWLSEPAYNRKIIFFAKEQTEEKAVLVLGPVLPDSGGVHYYFAQILRKIETNSGDLMI
jgi:hypothetical protein